MTVLLHSTVQGYWPVLGAVLLYSLLLAIFFSRGNPSTAWRAVLATGPAWLVFLWGVATVARLLHDGGTAVGDPAVVLRSGLAATLCLLPILALMITTNLVARRIAMPTAFTLGVGAAIAAVLTDLLLVAGAAILIE
jgi:hypothetical protein